MGKGGPNLYQLGTDVRRGFVGLWKHERWWLEVGRWMTWEGQLPVSFLMNWGSVWIGIEFFFVLIRIRDGAMEFLRNRWSGGASRRPGQTTKFHVGVSFIRPEAISINRFRDLFFLFYICGVEYNIWIHVSLSVDCGVCSIYNEYVPCSERKIR